MINPYLSINLEGVEELTDKELLNKEKFWLDIVELQEKETIVNDDQLNILKGNRSGLSRLDDEIKKRNLRDMKDWEKLFQ